MHSKSICPVLRATTLLSLCLLPSTIAKVGDTCTYKGIKGTCKAVNDCRNSFTISNLCPDDPANVKCCLTKQCTNTNGDGGVCLNNPKTAATACDGTFVTDRCPGPKDVQCCVFDAPPASPPSPEIGVYFWIDAFIPKTFEDVMIPRPNHPGETMLKALSSVSTPESGCYLGDSRGFSSNDDSATARMHSRAWIQISPSKWHWIQQHFCSPTHKVDCDDGDLIKTDTADADDMKFTLVRADTTSVVLKLKAAASNPLQLYAPKIDLEGTLTVNRVDRYVQFEGKVDDFPSFEAYVKVDGKAPRTIGTLGPKPGSDPTSLFTWNGVDRPFGSKVYF